MTAPLTPMECDLQDFPFMPLHVARLRDSDLAGEEAPEACWYAVLLWAASWHQLPAASLPDNDAILTKLVGLGRDVRTFRKFKDGALRGFVLCDDGRLYHPVVAEQAINAWNSKLQQRWRMECAKIKKRNQRDKTDHPAPTFEEFLSSIFPAPGPGSVPGDKPLCPSGQSLQEIGTGTGRPREEGSNDPSLSTGKPARASPKAKTPIAAGFPGEPEIAEAADTIRSAGVTLDPADHAKRFRGHALTNDRRVADWGAAWRSWVEIEIGKAPAAAAPPAPAEPYVWPGPADIWGLAVARMGSDWATGYVGRCVWRDGALVCPSPTIAKGIRGEIGRDLDGLGYRLLEGQAA